MAMQQVSFPTQVLALNKFIYINYESIKNQRKTSSFKNIVIGIRAIYVVLAMYLKLTYLLLMKWEMDSLLSRSNIICVYISI